MGKTKTQKKRYANAIYWIEMMGKPANKAVAAHRKEVQMRAAAADRRVEMRKGRSDD